MEMMALNATPDVLWSCKAEPTTPYFQSLKAPRAGTIVPRNFSQARNIHS